MRWKNEMRFAGNEQSVLYRNLQLLQGFHFTPQGDRIDDHTIAHDVHDTFPEDATGNRMENVFDTFEFQCMSRIGATLKAGDYLVLGCENVNDFSFAFVSPLEAEQNVYGHVGMGFRLDITGVEMKTSRGTDTGCSLLSVFAPSVLELPDGGRQVLGDGEYGIQFGDDQQFLDLVRNTADRGVAAILAAFRENVYKYIQPVAVQVTEVFHRDHKVVDAFLNDVLYFLQQGGRLILIDQVAAHFYNRVGAVIDDLIREIHAVKVRILSGKALSS